MKPIALLIFIAVLVVGCNKMGSSAANVTPVDSKLGDVTFKAHLKGDLASDPSVRKGQIIRVIPDPTEPTARHQSIVVHLPNQTPYDGIDEQYYLRGYAIGQLSAHNVQFW